MITLRPYQAADIHATRREFRSHRAVLHVSPTGSGKGTCCSYIVQSAVAKGKRVIFAVHGRPLVHDFSKRLARLGIEHGVIMGNSGGSKPWLRCHVASIDTLHRRENPPKADLICIDEAHWAISPTWQKALAKYPEAKVLGMTATPIRLDGRGLGEIFTSMVIGPSVEELIAGGYLVPSRVFSAALQPQVTEKTLKSDKALAEVCDQTRLVGDIVGHWQKHASDRKTVVFGVDQKHASHIAEQFRLNGIDCAYVDASTPDSERERIWEDFDSGNLRCISSVAVLSYGWDHPICSCVVLARPTSSVGLHLQQIGRGTRPAPGKADLLILDHAGNTQRHGFYEDPREWSLDGIAPDYREKPPSVTICHKCYATFRSGPLQCPYCGSMRIKQDRAIEVVAGELAEIQRERKLLRREEWAAKITGDGRREKYLELAAEGRAKGYKPGWAKLRFHSLFGIWPLKAWDAQERNIA